MTTSNRGTKAYRRAAWSTLVITIEKPKHGAVSAWSQSRRITRGYDAGRSFECGKAI